MKRVLSTSAMAVALWLAATPAAAQVVRMTATLSGGQETPAVNTGAAGMATVFLDVAGEEMLVELTVVNLPSASTAGHIHIAPVGQSGPVVIDFPIPAGRVGDLTLSFRVGAAGFRARPAIGINTMADAVQSILFGNAYVNIHTSANPAGEIRGQLTVVGR